MRIISQNNGYSVDFDHVMLILDYNMIEFQLVNQPTRELVVLGDYKTSERAEEIFMDIHKHYSLVQNGNSRDYTFKLPEE